jgi:signal transduction histidine kinase
MNQNNPHLSEHQAETTLHPDAFREAVLALTNLLEIPELARTLGDLLMETVPAQHIRLWMREPDPNRLVLALELHNGPPGPAMGAAPEASAKRAQSIHLQELRQSERLRPLLDGRMVTLAPGEAAGQLLVPTSEAEAATVTCAPILYDRSLVGVALFTEAEPALEPDSGSPWRTILYAAGLALQNALSHTGIVQEFTQTVAEMQLLAQLDRELNDTINLDHVFEMVLDWALRYTNAHAAGLALYSEEHDLLELKAQYGYMVPGNVTDVLQKPHRGGITHRVARSGVLEVVPEVSLDKDYLLILPSASAQLSVPVIREGRVIAVLTLESRRMNGFSENHAQFVAQLANRASVAIDNARLFAVTAAERQRLAQIVSSIDDSVILVGNDQRIILLNGSAISSLRLDPADDYTGMLLRDVIGTGPLYSAMQEAIQAGMGAVTEVQLPSGREYHLSIRRHSTVGWLAVMQDITPFRQTDRLKSELIAAVSHDLKQPVSVIRGYMDLLGLKNEFTGDSQRFVGHIYDAVTNMQNLIDGLLELARIEEGLAIERVPVDVGQIVRDAVDPLQPIAERRNIRLSLRMDDNLDLILGDRDRLRQVFTNLLTNAIKYGRDDGWINVEVSGLGSVVQVTVADNGMGISPDDQAQVFDRFYRVRRPETDAIEGTGLGLAIVKSLVELHKGLIDLESTLGKGTTIRVRFPVDPE